MLPEILGWSVPDAYLAGVPPVNKLTLLKSNKDLWESDEEKRTASEQSIVEEKMDAQTSQKAKRRQRKKKQKNQGVKMELEGESKDSKVEDETPDTEEKMETSQIPGRSRCRQRKEENIIDKKQINDT